MWCGVQIVLIRIYVEWYISNRRNRKYTVWLLSCVRDLINHRKKIRNYLFNKEFYFSRQRKIASETQRTKRLKKKTIILWMCDSVRFSPYDSIFFSTLRRSVHCSRREWKHHSHIQNDGVVSEVSGFSFVRLPSNTIQFSLKSSHITPFNNLNCLFIFVWWFFCPFLSKTICQPMWEP